MASGSTKLVPENTVVLIKKLMQFGERRNANETNSKRLLKNSCNRSPNSRENFSKLFIISVNIFTLLLFHKMFVN